MHDVGRLGRVVAVEPDLVRTGLGRRRELHVPRAAGAIHVDGELDDEIEALDASTG